MAETGERYPWYEPPYWEQVGAQAEQIAGEEGGAVARAHVTIMPCWGTYRVASAIGDRAGRSGTPPPRA